MSRRVKIGVIGCGVIGKTHCEAAATCDCGELVAVADLLGDRASEMARKYNVSRVYTQGSELLRDPDVEAVVLATPACDRGELALAAMAAGKHVLTEKPVAMNAGELRKLMAAQGSLVGGCCSSRYRHLASSVALAAFLAQGHIGRLRMLRSRGVLGAGPAPSAHQPPPPWRLRRDLNGGGILANWGCYDLDFLLGSLAWQLRPRVVLAQCWTLAGRLAARAAPGSDAETHALALIRCDDGVAIALDRGEATATATEHAHHFIGEIGSVRTVMTMDRKTAFHDHTDSAFGLMSRVIFDGTDPVTPLFSGPLHDFASAIVNGHPPKTTLAQALVVQQLTDAIYASAASGQAVTID